MNFIKTKIDNLIIIEPSVFGDARGYFLESFNKQKFDAVINNIHFVQDNESKSTKGVLRGLHFQFGEFAQSKLVRCIQGEVLDIAVDLRSGSKTYGQHVSVLLTGENKKQVFVPKGFAHGFVVLSETAIFAYKVDNWYSPNHEGGLLWNDTTLNIDWQIKTEDVKLSEKDKTLPSFADFKTPFE